MSQLCASGEIETLAPERVWTELEKALAGDYPVRFFDVLRSCGGLARILPEVDRLFGVPQTAVYHPEVDTGVHTMMVLDQAARLTSDTTIRFAALVHDLGKGTTPREILPAHHGHEERGARLVQELCGRLRIPNRYRDLAVLVSRYHFICHKIDELRANTVVEKLEAMDAFRQPERFEKFLVACEADARGRTGFEDLAYPQAGRFRGYFMTANSVDTKSIPMQDMQGPEIAAAIHRLRVNAISNTNPEISR
jgi:tRNA nucleotidyltransferase (CCA-adding enzyme)